MRDELTELFAPYDPEHVHEHIEPAEMAKILGEWKPRWIHAERSRELVRAIIAEAGFDPRSHALRRAEAANLVPRRPPDDGHRLRVPLAPGRLVQRARPADQLVAPGLPGTGDQRDELRPGEFRAGRSRTPRPTSTTTGTTPSGSARRSRWARRSRRARVPSTTRRALT